jgi:hypothetical protein
LQDYSTDPWYAGEDGNEQQHHDRDDDSSAEKEDGHWGEEAVSR